uniref:Uncharacterized protein n=1 Tax=Oryza rufipogon TaxID=4529 RepID=A0A0E0N894_ORYRU
MDGMGVGDTDTWSAAAQTRRKEATQNLFSFTTLLIVPIFFNSTPSFLPPCSSISIRSDLFHPTLPEETRHFSLSGKFGIGSVGNQRIGLTSLVRPMHTDSLLLKGRKKVHPRSLNLSSRYKNILEPQNQICGVPQLYKTGHLRSLGGFQPGFI